jgi:putative flippase GtrA
MNVFIKAQFNSVVSTLLDFAITVLLKQVAGTWYLAASVLGALSGGICNFLLGRYWVFKATQKPLLAQLGKYAGVWTGSLLLNTAGLYWLTDVQHLDYLLSKTIMVIFVAVCYNFIFQKYFVFST